MLLSSEIYIKLFKMLIAFKTAKNAIRALTGVTIKVKLIKLN
jgi:hypothetical protein